MRTTRGSLFALVALLAPACLSTTQTAHHARAPVLLGPVACVGCAPRQARQPPAPPTLSDTSSFWSWGVPPVNATGFGGSPSRLDLQLGNLSDPCHQEVVLRAVQTESFGMDALVFWKMTSSVEVTGDHTAVPGGSCDMSIVRWPLSGPTGIRWPVAPQPPGASGPVPAPPPPPPAR